MGQVTKPSTTTAIQPTNPPTSAPQVQVVMPTPSATPAPTAPVTSVASNPQEVKSEKNADWKVGAKAWLDLLSPFFMPLVVLGLGWLLTGKLQREGVDQKYIEIALGILADDKNPPDAPIRKWAFKLLNKYSPEKFESVDPQLPLAVQNGLARLSPDAFTTAGMGVLIGDKQTYLQDRISKTPFQAVATSENLYRCELLYVQYKEDRQPVFSITDLDEKLELHILAPGGEILERQTLDVRGGSVTKEFTLKPGQTAKVFNSSSKDIYRGTGMFKVLRDDVQN